jgi:hypothetical protein
MHQRASPTRLSIIIPIAAPIATIPPVPMPPLPVEFELPGELGAVLFVGDGGETSARGGGANLIFGGDNAGGLESDGTGVA